MKLEDKISAIPDFPKPGILFRHFGPILADPNAMAFMVEEFAKKINPSEVDVFVGIESRGFIIATALALHYKKTPSSSAAATKAYVDESMVVIAISYAPFNVEKLPVPSEMPKTADIESGSVTFII